jgi:uncharacterized protein YjiS (DUF1127 family)
MVAIDFRTPSKNSDRAPLSLALAALHRVWDGALWLPRFWKRRREFGVLVAMGNRGLQDIGLTPFDIANALEQPSKCDATAYLADVVRDRRLRKQM